MSEDIRYKIDLTTMICITNCKYIEDHKVGSYACEHCPHYGGHKNNEFSTVICNFKKDSYGKNETNLQQL